MIDYQRDSKVQNLKSIILISGLVIMVAMGLYPPWVYQDRDGKQVPMGYSAVWDPPQQKIDKKGNIFGFKFDVEVGIMKANSINMVQLLMQEAMACAITFGGAMVSAKISGESKEKKKEEES